MESLNVKKIFLYLMICSIALSALMGIWAILSGDVEYRVLGTTLTIVGTSILGLACGAFLENPRSQKFPLIAIPVVGIILSVLSALITIWLIWMKTNWSDEVLFKTLAVSSIFAFALSHLSLLSIAQLSRRFRWSLITAFVVIFALASIISFIIVFEPPSESGIVLRLIGVLAVIDAALTVMIPIFHRLSRTEFVDIPSVAEIEAKIAGLKAQITRLEKQKEDVLRAEQPA
ncbi:MAG TPA: hypothetical protein VGB68_16680 [Pyrinomonadaceae bacterium]